MPLNGKVALVTGGSRGIGRAIALRLGAEGAAVAVNFREARAGAKQVEEQIRASGGRAHCFGADVGDAAQVRQMIAEIEDSLGPIDLLVNNAGVLRRGDLADFDFTQMEGMRRINVDGLVHVTRAAAEGMKQRGYGRIVNLSSIAALGTALAGTTFYAATKAAVITLTRRFALELGPHGITVNCVSPGFIVTDMASVGRTGAELEQLKSTMAERTMVRRVGQPDDIANAVAFLLAEASGFVTAQNLVVDGGRMDYIAHP